MLQPIQIALLTNMACLMHARHGVQCQDLSCASTPSLKQSAIAYLLTWTMSMIRGARRKCKFASTLYQIIDSSESTSMYDIGNMLPPGMTSAFLLAQNSNSSQFYITLAAAPQCDGKHVVVGTVTEGLDILQRIGRHPSPAHQLALTWGLTTSSRRAAELVHRASLCPCAALR